MKKLQDFFKKETVLSIALLLAIVSSFIILPDREYISYIDFRTLAILFCLMSVMAGFQKLGMFGQIANNLIRRVRSEGQLVLVLVMLCFVFSMFITNDVALITFVPLTFAMVKMLGDECSQKLLIPVTVLQTIAANLGSMLTPIGNPQNLYLYGKAGLSVWAFLKLMLPYTLFSLMLLLLCCAVCTRHSATSEGWHVAWKNAGRRNAKGGNLKDWDALQKIDSSVPDNTVVKNRSTMLNNQQIVVYLILFVISLLTVAHMIPYTVTLAITVIVVSLMDKQVFTKVDYSLLLTFVAFFIFIGNMGRIPAFRDFLQNIVEGNEVFTAIVSSQVISNVPAALLLSGFSTNYEALIVGTNLGGLGTLIASMAGLITYKLVAREAGERKGAYLLYFTVANVCFLAALVILYVCVGV